MFNYYMSVFFIIFYTSIIIYETREFKKLDYKFLIHAMCGILWSITLDTLTIGMGEIEKEIEYLKSLKDE